MKHVTTGWMLVVVRACPSPVQTREGVDRNRVLQSVPLATEPGISLIILALMRILQKKFEADYRHIPLHFSHNERIPVQISFQYLHWC